MQEITKKPFEMVDPYNKQNTVTGIIFRDIERYGDLDITHVNGREASQYVIATPKFYYPGHHQSPRHAFTLMDFPDTSFSVYEKLDGTNILMFKYKDADGKEFVSFKTRLVPFLRTDGFKDWIAMWKQVVDKRPDIISYMTTLPGNHAFEMYGFLNEILVKYEVDIDFRYLYTINEKGSIFHRGNVDRVDGGTDRCQALSIYELYVTDAERMFKDGKRAEGFMFYFDDGTVYKCKPICVVEEQGDSPFIGRDDIYVTAINASESIDTVDELLGTTMQLLAEVYDEKKIERSKPRIEDTVAEARSYLLVQKEAMNVMKEMGFSWSEENKAHIMRAVMQKFPKKMSSKIYGMLSGKKTSKNEKRGLA